MKVKNTGEEIQIYDFDSAEALKIAQNLERKGIRFYGNLLVKTSDPSAKEVFRYLNDQEEEHLRLFEALLERVDPEALDSDGDTVESSVDDGVFDFPLDLDSMENLDAALSLAITIEKRTLAFYLEVIKHTEDGEGKNTIKKIIAEEKKHWEELQKLAQ